MENRKKVCGCGRGYTSYYTGHCGYCNSKEQTQDLRRAFSVEGLSQGSIKLLFEELQSAMYWDKKKIMEKFKRQKRI